MSEQISFNALESGRAFIRRARCNRRIAKRVAASLVRFLKENDFKIDSATPVFRKPKKVKA